MAAETGREGVADTLTDFQKIVIERDVKSMAIDIEEGKRTNYRSHIKAFTGPYFYVSGHVIIPDYHTIECDRKGCCCNSKCQKNFKCCGNMFTSNYELFVAWCANFEINGKKGVLEEAKRIDPNVDTSLYLEAIGRELGVNSEEIKHRRSIDWAMINMTFDKSEFIGCTPSVVFDAYVTEFGKCRNCSEFSKDMRIKHQTNANYQAEIEWAIKRGDPAFTSEIASLLLKRWYGKRDLYTTQALTAKYNNEVNALNSHVYDNEKKCDELKKMLDDIDVKLNGYMYDPKKLKLSNETIE